MKVWIVMKVYESGKREPHEAYFSEEKARYSVSCLAGTVDHMAVTLVAISVRDNPTEADMPKYIKPL